MTVWRCYLFFFFLFVGFTFANASQYSQGNPIIDQQIERKVPDQEKYKEYLRLQVNAVKNIHLFVELIYSFLFVFISLNLQLLYFICENKKKVSSAADQLDCCWIKMCVLQSQIALESWPRN